MLTTFSNRQEIIDLVWACDLTRHGIQSIVLFGSRAKGTHTTDSDWDLAFLVDDPSVEYVVSLHDYWPGNPFQDYDNVDACVLTPTYLKAHMYDFGQLSHQIARHGEPLLGKWFINTELLDIMTQSRPDDWRRNLSQSYEYLDDFFIYIRKFKEEEDYERIRSIGNGLVITSQRAAEHLVKGIAVRRYIEPRKSHDIAGLADDLWNQRPDDVDQTLWLDFTNRIRALDGHALQDNQAAYEVIAPCEETIRRACVRVGRTLTLFADEVASVMGLSSKSLKGNDCRENLRTYAAGYGVNLRRLCAKGQEVFSMPNRDKGVLPPNSDVGGVMTLPRHLELLKEPLASALAKKIQTETIP